MISKTIVCYILSCTVLATRFDQCASAGAVPDPSLLLEAHVGAHQVSNPQSQYGHGLFLSQLEY